MPKFASKNQLVDSNSDLFKEVLNNVLYCIDDIADQCGVDTKKSEILKLKLDLRVVRPGFQASGLANFDSIQISSDYFFQNEFSSVGEEAMHYIDLNMNLDRTDSCDLKVSHGLEFLAKLYSNIVSKEKGQPFMRYIPLDTDELKVVESEVPFSLEKYCIALKKRRLALEHATYLNADRLFIVHGLASRKILKKTFNTPPHRRDTIYGKVSDNIGTILDAWA